MSERIELIWLSGDADSLQGVADVPRLISEVLQHLGRTPLKFVDALKGLCHLEAGEACSTVFNCRPIKSASLWNRSLEDPGDVFHFDDGSLPHRLHPGWQHPLIDFERHFGLCNHHALAQ